jgi:hypothetical protein
VLVCNIKLRRCSTLRFADKREGSAGLAIFPARATCEIESGDIAAVVPDLSGASGLLGEERQR